MDYFHQNRISLTEVVTERIESLADKASDDESKEES